MEAIRAGSRLKRLLLAEGASGEEIDGILKLAKEQGVSAAKTGRRRLDALCHGNHQGVMAWVLLPREDADGIIEKARQDRGVLVLLDGLLDPQNVGAIARSALCFGACGILTGDRRSASFSPAAFKASAGALSHLPHAEVTNIAQRLRELKEDGFSILGTDSSGEDIRTIKIEFPLALVIGSEAEGLRKITRDLCDTLVRIPISGNVSSLNASCAAALVFYELSRFRDKR